MTDAGRTGAARPSLANRATTACIAGAVVLLLAAIAPVAAVLALRDHGLVVLGAYLTFWRWGLPIVLLAAATGFVLGADRTTVLFNHGLLVARPRDWPRSIAVWTALAGYAVLGAVLP